MVISKGEDWKARIDTDATFNMPGCLWLILTTVARALSKYREVCMCVCVKCVCTNLCMFVCVYVCTQSHQAHMCNSMAKSLCSISFKKEKSKLFGKAFSRPSPPKK